MEDLDDEDIRALFDSEAQPDPWLRPGDRIGPHIVVAANHERELLADGPDGRVVVRLESYDPDTLDREDLERRISTIFATLRTLAHPAIRPAHTGGRLERSVHTRKGTRTVATLWSSVAPGADESFHGWPVSRPWTAVLGVLRDVAAALAAAEAAGIVDCVPFPDDIRVGPDLRVQVDVATAALRALRMRGTTLQVAFFQDAWRALGGGSPPRLREDIPRICHRLGDLPPWLLALLERGAYGPPWPSMAAVAAELTAGA